MQTQTALNCFHAKVCAVPVVTSIVSHSKLARQLVFLCNKKALIPKINRIVQERWRRRRKGSSLCHKSQCRLPIRLLNCVFELIISIGSFILSLSLWGRIIYHHHHHRVNDNLSVENFIIPIIRRAKAHVCLQI